MANILDIVTGGTGGALGAVAGVVGKVLDRIIPDPAQKAAAALKLAELAQNGELARMANETALAQGQMEVNKIEAGGDWFRAGWRPFVGWICGGGLGIQFVIAPLVAWGSALVGHPTTMPPLDLGTLMTLLFGMLGLGAYRTYEKVKP